MAEILHRRIRLAVEEATDGTKIEPAKFESAARERRLVSTHLVAASTERRRAVSDWAAAQRAAVTLIRAADRVLDFELRLDSVLVALRVGQGVA